MTFLHLLVHTQLCVHVSSLGASCFFFSRFRGVWCFASSVCCSSWPVHPSFAPTLSATPSSNLLFVWKSSIIFLSMIHWPKASRWSTLNVFFLLWSHVFVLVKLAKNNKNRKSVFTPVCHIHASVWACTFILAEISQKVHQKLHISKGMKLKWRPVMSGNSQKNSRNNFPYKLLHTFHSDFIFFPALLQLCLPR